MINPKKMGDVREILTFLQLDGMEVQGYRDVFHLIYEKAGFVECLGPGAIWQKRGNKKDAYSVLSGRP